MLDLGGHPDPVLQVEVRGHALHVLEDLGVVQEGGLVLRRLAGVVVEVGQVRQLHDLVRKVAVEILKCANNNLTKDFQSCLDFIVCIQSS